MQKVPATSLMGYGSKLSRAAKLVLDCARDYGETNQNRHVAGVFYKGALVVLASNSYHKSHPFQARWGRNPESIYLHAEVAATIKAQRFLSSSELEKSTLLVGRVYKDGSFGPSKPCKGCYGLIQEINYNQVFFTTLEGWARLK